MDRGFVGVKVSVKYVHSMVQEMCAAFVLRLRTPIMTGTELDEFVGSIKFKLN